LPHGHAYSIYQSFSNISSIVPILLDVYEKDKYVLFVLKEICQNLFDQDKQISCA